MSERELLPGQCPQSTEGCVWEAGTRFASSFRAFSGWQTACRTVLTGRAGNVLHHWFSGGQRESGQDVLTRPFRLHPPGMSQCAEELAGAWQSCSGFIQRQMRRPNSHSLIELPNKAQSCRKVSEWTFQPPWKVREMGGQCYGQLVRSPLSVLFLGFLLLNRLKGKMHDIPRIAGWRPGSGQ